MNDATACLLTYLSSSTPSPIQISTSQTTATARIDTSVSTSSGTTVYCNQIIMAYPTGESDDGAVFAQPPTGSLNTSTWALATSIKTGAELGMGDVDQTYTTFIFTCSDATKFQINYNLVFGALGQVNGLTGDFNIMVKETSGTTSDPSTFTDKVGGFTLTKGMPEFYLTNFIATNPNTPTVPVTDFPNGTQIFFEWGSNGTFFQLFAKGTSAPIYAGTSTNFTLAAGIARDTTFVLVASVTGNPSGDSGSGGYTPIYLYDALTITVSNPDLTPKSVTAGTLAVSGNSTLTGTLAVTGATTLAAAQAASLNVSGASALTGATTLGGTLAVSGSTTLAATTINQGATINNGLLVNGSLQGLGGQVVLFQAAVAIATGNYGSVGTDGLVIGMCGSPSDVTQHSVGWIYGASGAVSVQAIGGNTCTTDSSWNKYQTSNKGTFVLPVQKGNGFNISIQQSDKNQTAAPTAFYWCPFGTGPGPSSDIHALRQGDPLQPDNPGSESIRKPVTKLDYVPELVSVIEALTERTIPEPLLIRLTEVLTKMNKDDYIQEF